MTGPNEELLCLGQQLLSKPLAPGVVLKAAPLKKKKPTPLSTKKPLQFLMKFSVAIL
jgi:hypothetical protein